MRKSTPVKIKMYYPQTDEGRQELARCVSDVHSDHVVAQIDKMNVPIKEKLRMLETVVATRKRARLFPVSETRDHDREDE